MEEGTRLRELLPARSASSKRAHKLILVGTSLVDAEEFEEAVLEEQSAAVARELERAERMAAEQQRLRVLAEEREREAHERELALQRRVEERRRQWVDEQRRTEMNVNSELTFVLPGLAASSHVVGRDEGGIRCARRQQASVCLFVCMFVCLFVCVFFFSPCPSTGMYVCAYLRLRVGMPCLYSCEWISYHVCL
jgi:hypothetical protein